ncbi:MAG TPA: hypothetical protein VLB74_10060 [Flavobacterium sp.]|uniref:hypothetical protein n=1 Tax=Flavobacterium sp. TaxID=239 RepID=UPI002C1EBFF1|nr:hypothetical protein [Flavobacterium sp.]HSD14980.1 hypothetical protein [Flavobacterium sp.]
MKKTVFALLAFVLLTAVNGQAQSKSTPMERAEKITTWMKDNLNLTPEQIPLVQELNLKYAKMNEELKNMAGPRKNKMEKLKSNDIAKENELKNILTPDQYKLYESKKRELKTEAKKRHKEKQKM